MATATQVELSTDTQPSFIIKTKDENKDVKDLFSMTEAIYLAGLCRTALNTLFSSELSDIIKPSQAYTANDILALPLDKHRIPDVLHDLPSRKSSRHALAVALASLLHPVHEGSLTAIIRYDADRVRLRAWAVLQRRYDLLKATKNNGRMTQDLTGGVGPGVQAPAWASRITNQGPWDSAKRPVSLDGVQAIPMPVQVSREEELAPFLKHLRQSGNHELTGGEGGVELDGGKGEPYYGVRGAEFRKGVVYEDGRMDLCKMVVGPDHIWRLMDSLRPNHFVRHFLLGNNIIGPSGAKAIADFVNEFPNRMETWYLAGNCIDGESFKILVDALIKSPVVSDVWLKRNPLGPDAAGDVYRLITKTKNLQTLDLDQTQLGDRGISDLFNLLAAYSGPEGVKLPLRQLYINGNGISKEGAAAIGRFLASPHCGVTSIYMSCNPLGNEGATALAEALPKAPYLARLFLQSVGVSTQGAVALFKALTGHSGIRSFDLGQAYATEDLSQAYNYVDDAAVSALTEFLQGTPQLQYFNLGHCATSPPGLLELTPAVLSNPALLYFAAISILADSTRQAATFIPGKDTAFQSPEAPSLDQIKSDKAIREHLEANVRAHYGADMSYVDFMQDEKRWLVNDKVVRKIDSVYRNRDAGMARRGLMTLIKDWKEGDDTLERIMKSTGPPMCSLRKRH
ncbi:Protein NLRC3-like protein [Cladobotryum mycophilum]|uniref:Protein NLRC3-like protein n=1 Tax=Cladobotryum mycophilum TaxID=491253 RepID=A0ABR0STQ9_9HYPO